MADAKINEEMNDDIFELAKHTEITEGKPDKNPQNYVHEDTYYSEFQEVDLQAEEEFRWSELQNDFKKKRVLEGFLYAVVPNETNTRVDLITEIHGFSVIIPDFAYFFDSSFNDSYWEASEREQLRRRLQMGRNRLYSRVRFVIEGAEVFQDEDGNKEYKVFGSRLNAMAQIREEWKTGTRKHEALKAGDIVDLSVISVGELFAILDGFGMEWVLKFDKIDAYRFVTSASDALQVGDTIQALVKKVYFNEDGTYSNDLSASAIGLSEIEQKNAEIRKHSALTGVVMNYNPTVKKYTVIVQSKKARVTVNEDSVKGKKKHLDKGDIVSVFITSKNTNKNINYGTARFIRSGRY